MIVKINKKNGTKLKCKMYLEQKHLFWIIGKKRTRIKNLNWERNERCFVGIEIF